MGLHQEYAEATRSLKICRRCACFSHENRKSVFFLCSHDVDPWDTFTLREYWDQAYVPKACPKLALFETLETLRRL